MNWTKFLDNDCQILILKQFGDDIKSLINLSSVCKSLYSLIKNNIWNWWINNRYINLKPHHYIAVEFDEKIDNDYDPILNPYSTKDLAILKPYIYAITIISFSDIGTNLVIDMLTDMVHIKFYLSACIWKPINIETFFITQHNISVIGVNREKTIIDASENNGITVSHKRFCKTNLITISNLTCQSFSKDSNKEYFGIRISKGNRAIINKVNVSNTTLSGILIDREAYAEISECNISNCTQNGVFIFQASANIYNNTITNCSALICVKPVHIFDKTIINNNTLNSLTDKSAITIYLPKDTPGAYFLPDQNQNIIIDITSNKINRGWNGIYMIYYKAENVASLKTCKRFGFINIQNNTISSPVKHGIFMNSMKHHDVVISHNKITNTRYAAITQYSPLKYNNVVIENNIFESTGETNGYYKGIQDCYDKQICTKRITGEELKLQEWYICKQCNLTSAKNLGCCKSCAEICHKFHRGLKLSVRLTDCFCDCPDLCGCKINTN